MSFTLLLLVPCEHHCWIWFPVFHGQWQPGVTSVATFASFLRTENPQAPFYKSKSYLGALGLSFPLFQYRGLSLLMLASLTIATTLPASISNTKLPRSPCLSKLYIFISSVSLLFCWRPIKRRHNTKPWVQRYAVLKYPPPMKLVDIF